MFVNKGEINDQKIREIVVGAYVIYEFPKRKRENVPQDSEENTGFTKLGVFDAKDKAKVRRVLPKWLAQPDIVSLDLGDQQMPIEDMKELDESILQILKSTGAKYFFPVQRQVIPQLIMVKLTTCFHEFSKHEFTIFFLANIMSYLF